MLSEKLKYLARITLDVFYPRDCVYSGQRLAYNSLFRFLSDSAISQINWVSEPACRACGYPLHVSILHNSLCSNCIDLEPEFSEGKTLFLLKNAGRNLIHELKYRQGFHLWPDVAKLVQKSPSYINFIENSILLPIPLHSSKLRYRGFNQSLIFAQILAKLNPSASVCDLLIRIKPTQAQACLSKTQRLANVRNAFSFNPKYVINKSLKYVLIDDVFTTGATLNSCARVLKKQGVTQVNVLTLGHG